MHDDNTYYEKQAKIMANYLAKNQHRRHEPIVKAPCSRNDRIIQIFEDALRPERGEYSKDSAGEKKYKEALKRYFQAEEAAVHICQRCPFQQQCLAESLTRTNYERRRGDFYYSYDMYGVFGGKTADERKEIFSRFARLCGYHEFHTTVGVRYVDDETYQRLIQRSSYRKKAKQVHPSAQGGDSVQQ